jgi:hypothetical protein
MATVESSKSRVQSRTVLALAIGLMGMATATAALAQSDPVDLAVVDRETDQRLRVWRHHGRLFVAGELGDRYSLRVTNNTEGRVLVVLSVDGVNVLTGETAGYGQRGYVLSAHASYDVPGWRKSLTEVADFTFAPLPQAYAARTGRPSDVGVIGMAVFNEKVAVQAYAAGPPPPPPPPLSAAADLRSLARTSPAAPPPDIAPPALPLPPIRTPQPESIAPPQPVPPSPPAPAAPPPRFAAFSDRSAATSPLAKSDEKLGTAHGIRELSVTYTVAFVRATPYPQAVEQIEYDTFDHLVASGVIPVSVQHPPRPFPATPTPPGFVPDPPGER